MKASAGAFSMASMLILFLHILVSSTPTADLTPPFYANDKNRVGFWDVGGSSLVFDDRIILSPPIQFRKGSVWDSLPVPYGEWALDVVLNVSDGSGGGFAVWLINQHGADGPLFGGPQVFSGAAVTASIVNDRYGLNAKFNIIQSQGADKFETDEVMRESESSLRLSNQPICLRVHITKESIALAYVKITQDGDQVTELVRKELSVDLGQAWLGITAMSDEYTSRFDLLSAKIDVVEFEKFGARRRQSDSKKLSRQSKFIDADQIRLLRNPSFVQMKKELASFNGLNGVIGESDKQADNIFKICDEFGRVLSEVATYKQLNNFIRNTMIPYAQSWHRRTFKIIENVGTAKTLLSESFNQTEALISIFNSTITQMIAKTDRKIIKLTDLLENVTKEQTIHDDESMKDIVKQSPLVAFLRIFSVVEVILIVVYYIVQTRNSEV